MGIFSIPEINKLIDENYKLVQKNGYAELRIPEKLHKISREKISDNAINAAEKLINAGFQAYLVGGSVRDLVLGTQVNDFDIVTDAPFQEEAKIFEGHFNSHPYQNGITYGVALYPDEVIDLAEMRNIPAAYYGLKNIPDFNPKELFSNNLRNDSFQRDLTFNALYYDFKTGDIVTFNGGLHDLRDGIIESPADPDVHFTDDPTSAIRALRFKARYNFKFSEQVEEAMRKNALKYMKLLKPDSVPFQFASMFAKDYGLASYKVLNDYGVFSYFFPSLKDFAETREYKKYAERAMKFIEAQKSQDIRNLWLALLLWPAVNKYDADTVLEAQGKIYKFRDGEVNALKKFFELEKEMANIASVYKLQ